MSLHSLPGLPSHAQQREQSALGLHKAICAQQTTATQQLENVFAAIAATDDQLQAFNALHADQAMATAQWVDAQAKAGNPLPLLAGVPIAIKDNMHLEGTPTTCSSHILKGYMAPYNATVTQALLNNGMPIVGKTNMDEFAMGSSTENSAFKKTRNPWGLDRVPGGSSGGAAACVAGGQVLLSLGSDTGGSVRQPAALCGIVGLKPTYGLVSRYGLVAFASSLDQISPFATNVDDTAALLSVIMGQDPQDATSLPVPQGFDPMAQLDQGVEGLTIGVITELLDSPGLQPEVAENMAQAIDTYKALGATIKRISIPSSQYAIAVYYILATAEASSNLARFDGVRFGHSVRGQGNNDLLSMYTATRGEGFGPEVKRRIMLGTYALSSGYYDAYYGKAQKVQALMRQEFAQAFSQVDVLLGPTSPTTAFKFGEKANDPLSMYLSDIATIPTNLVGVPGISLPSGFDNQGLPIGLQLMANHFAEPTLLRAAKAFEQASGLRQLAPKAFAHA
jgi:aspartyl-tRNA(Asn)/glutamyl-tRNA(Gln) amidotransferase subunit A